MLTVFRAVVLSVATFIQGTPYVRQPLQRIVLFASVQSKTIGDGLWLSQEQRVTTTYLMVILAR